MKIIYRISDNGYIKPKLPNATKKICIENFISIFEKIDIVIADNCSPSTLEFLNAKKLNVIETSLGNAESFLYALNLAIGEPEDEIIYFVEDDYLHRPLCRSLLEDALSIADYATLYDHPDKYSKYYNFGEMCHVRRIKNQHWRSSISTTMTFASKVKTLKEDVQIFKNICGNRFHPNDHQIFIDLKEKNNRNLFVSIPGFAFHADISSNVCDIENLENEIDDWVVKWVEKYIPIEYNEIYKLQKISNLKKILMINHFLNIN